MLPTASWSPAAWPWKSADATRPALQKKMIRMARDMNKLTITAMQTTELIITLPVPTRAERPHASPQRRARRHHGGDAVGRDGERQVPGRGRRVDGAIRVEAERSAEVTLTASSLTALPDPHRQSIAMAVIWTAHHLKVKAIAAPPQSGSTALWISRLNCGVPTSPG